MRNKNGKNIENTDNNEGHENFVESDDEALTEAEIKEIKEMERYRTLHRNRKYRHATSMLALKEIGMFNTKVVRD